MEEHAQEDVDAAVQRKIQNMRTKLSMAKQMLEELLAERDEMDRVHGEEMQQLDETLQQGEEEKERLKEDILIAKTQLLRLDDEAARDNSIFEIELSEVNREEEALRDQINAETEAHRRVLEQLRLLTAAAEAKPDPEPIIEVIVPPAVIVAAAVLIEEQPAVEDEETLQEDPDELLPADLVPAAADLPLVPAAELAVADDEDENEEPDDEEDFDQCLESPAMRAHPLNYTGTPVSALKCGRGKRKVGSRVQFGMVCVRAHAVELGGGGGVPLDGSPLGLGWSFETQDPVTIDDWEDDRAPSRISKDVFMRQGYIPPDERREKLRALGFDDDELDSSADIMAEVQKERKESVDELEPDKELVAIANAFMWWWMCAQGLDSYLDS